MLRKVRTKSAWEGEVGPVVSCGGTVSWCHGGKQGLI